MEEANSIDVDRQESPNPLVPELNEVLWGLVGFAIVFGFAKVGYPAMKKGMDARTERIQGDLDAAEAQRTEAAGILDEYKAQLADARQESARIIEEARQAADSVRSDLQARAESDIAELRARANADIESAKAQAIADLRGEVTALAIGAAEQVGPQPRPGHQRRARRGVHQLGGS
ncbi:MAG: F0F1 ATP synthase subunit B [Acidimicrobiales bacterium]